MRRTPTIAVTALTGALAFSLTATPAAALSATYLDYGSSTVGGALSTFGFDADGAIFVPDQINDRVRKLEATPSGYSQTGEIAAFDPYGVAIEPDGDIAVTSRAAGTVTIFRDSGVGFVVEQTIPLGGQPMGIAAAADGTLFVAAYDSDVIRVINQSGSGYSLGADIPVADTPRFVAVAADGTVAVSHQAGTQVTILEPDTGGYTTSRVEVGPALYGVAFRADGALLAVESGFSASELHVVQPSDAGWGVTSSRALPGSSYSVVVAADDAVIVGTLTGRLNTYRAALTTTASLPASIPAGTAFSAALAAEGGSGDYAWSVASGSLPAGLTLDASGQLSGTPTAVGPWSATLSVVDAANTANATSVVLSGTVAPAADGGVVAPATPPAVAAVDEPVATRALAATGADPAAPLAAAALLVLGGMMVFAAARRGSIARPAGR